jgi:hypothetical protein
MRESDYSEYEVLEVNGVLTTDANIPRVILWVQIFQAEISLSKPTY